MSESHSDDPNAETLGRARLEEILAELMEIEDCKDGLDVESFIQRYPAHEKSIRDFLDDRRQLGLSKLAGKDSFEMHTIGMETYSTNKGTTIKYFGDYELISEIARGGMGVVYKALQTSLKRPVALKMILAGELASERDIERFKSEAESAANLQHPNIVPIYEIGQHEEQHYFSMALIEGSSLSERLSEGVMPPREAARLVLDVTKAVHYAHQQGVVHRDLKPSNILIDAEGKPLITDFGLAKRDKDSGLTATGEMLGTPGYMAPEQTGAGGDAITPAADVYGLGAVLYAAVTGRPPFQAASVVETINQVISKDPVSAIQLNSQVPRDLDVICMKCLEKRAAKRYESAHELALDLARFLNGEPIVARPISSIEKCWKWMRRHPALSSVTAAALLFVTLGVAGVYWQWREAEIARREAEKLAVAERGARQLSDERAEQLQASQRTLKIELHKSKLLEADKLFGEKANARAESLYWQEHENCPLEDPLLSRWRLRQLYWQFPKLGHIARDIDRFCQQGNMVAVTKGSELRVFDTETNQQLFSLHSPVGELATPTISEDQHFVACGHLLTREIAVWDLRQETLDPTIYKAAYDLKDPIFGAVGKAYVDAMIGKDDQGQSLYEKGREMLQMSRPTLEFIADGRLLALYGAGVFECELGNANIELLYENASKGVQVGLHLAGVSRDGKYAYIVGRGAPNRAPHSLLTRLNVNEADSELKILCRSGDVVEFREKYDKETAVNANIIAYSPNEDRFAILGSEERKIQFVDATSGKVTGSFTLADNVGNLSSFQFSQDGSLLAIVGTFAIEIADTSDMQRVATVRPLEMNTSQSQVPRHVSFSRDNRRLFVKENEAETIALTAYAIPGESKFNEFSREYETKYVVPEVILAPANRIVSIASRPDDYRIQTWQGEESLAIRDISTGLLGPFLADWSISGHAVIPTADELVVSKSGEKPSLEILDIDTLKSKRSIKLPYKPQAASDVQKLLMRGSTLSQPWMAEDGSIGVVDQDHRLSLIDFQKGEVRFQSDVRGTNLVYAKFSPNMESVAVVYSDGSSAVTSVHDTANGDLIAQSSFSEPVNCVAWIDESNLALGMYGSGLIEVRTVQGNMLLKKVPLGEAASVIERSPTESVLAVGTYSGRIVIVDTLYFTQVAEFKTQPLGKTVTRRIKQLQFDADGLGLRYVAESIEGRIDLTAAESAIAGNAP